MVKICSKSETTIINPKIISHCDHCSDSPIGLRDYKLGAIYSTILLCTLCGVN